ncbi:MAG TPA: YwgA family protein [Bacillota bacterium]|nr:YwgA family protein [Bacillota bacterium]
MLTNHAKLLHFFIEANEVTGRKKLQKMIYILQVCGIPFGEKFHYHFYGPYSEELSLRVEELCNLGFLKEDREDKSNYIQYHYQITREGVDFLQQFSLEMPEMSQKIGLLQQQSARFLELVATMLYFKDDLPPNEVEKKISVVKPKQNYSPTELKTAWQFIERMSH